MYLQSSQVRWAFWQCAQARLAFFFLGPSLFFRGGCEEESPLSSGVGARLRFPVAQLLRFDIVGSTCWSWDICAGFTYAVEGMADGGSTKVKSGRVRTRGGGLDRESIIGTCTTVFECPRGGRRDIRGRDDCRASRRVETKPFTSLGHCCDCFI